MSQIFAITGFTCDSHLEPAGPSPQSARARLSERVSEKCRLVKPHPTGRKQGSPSPSNINPGGPSAIARTAPLFQRPALAECQRTSEQVKSKTAIAFENMNSSASQPCWGISSLFSYQCSFNLGRILRSSRSFITIRPVRHLP